MAIATLNISAWDFYELTPREFHHAVQEARRIKEAQTRTLYEITRFALLHLWNSGIRKLRRPLRSVKDLLEFPWERSSTQKPQSLQEMKNEMISIFRAFGGKMNKRKKEGETL